MISTEILMVAVVAVFSKSVLAVTNDHKTQILEKLIQVATECYKDIPLSEEELTALKSKKLETDNAKCFGACVFKKAGIFDDKGTMSHGEALDKAKGILQHDHESINLDQFFTVCSKVNSEAVSDGEKGCDRAKLAFDCFTENAEKFGYNLDFEKKNTKV